MWLCACGACLLWRTTRYNNNGARHRVQHGRVQDHGVIQQDDDVGRGLRHDQHPAVLQATAVARWSRWQAQDPFRYSAVDRAFGRVGDSLAPPSLRRTAGVLKPVSQACVVKPAS